MYYTAILQNFLFVYAIDNHYLYRCYETIHRKPLDGLVDRPSGTMTWNRKVLGFESWLRLCRSILIGLSRLNESSA